MSLTLVVHRRSTQYLFIPKSRTPWNCGILGKMTSRSVNVFSRKWFRSYFEKKLAKKKRTIGMTVRNFLVAVNCIPWSSCSHCVKYRAFPSSMGIHGVPFVIWSKRKFPRLWIVFVRVHAQAAFSQGFTKNRRWRMIVMTIYVAHVPLALSQEWLGLKLPVPSPTIIVSARRKYQNSFSLCLVAVVDNSKGFHV